MDAFFANQPALWLTVGFLLLGIEAIAFGFGSGVLLFGSLGAILTGILLWMGVVPNQFIAAVACFGLATGLITLGLWAPLKRMQSGTDLGNDRSSDLIGHRFVLSTAVSRQVHGSEKFSGISWRVEPAETLGDTVLPAGTTVAVSSVKVGVFYVEPAVAL
jgi:membrane protein implicated in regulation of membrane protease activity